MKWTTLGSRVVHSTHPSFSRGTQMLLCGSRTYRKLTISAKRKLTVII
jgi:hypothetical protein